MKAVTTLPQVFLLSLLMLFENVVAETRISIKIYTVLESSLNSQGGSQPGPAQDPTSHLLSLTVITERTSGSMYSPKWH